jgi:hypothetical protein
VRRQKGVRDRSRRSRTDRRLAGRASPSAMWPPHEPPSHRPERGGGFQYAITSKGGDAQTETAEAISCTVEADLTTPRAQKR